MRIPDEDGKTQFRDAEVQSNGVDSMPVQES
jgi:hypothetical protein